MPIYMDPSVEEVGEPFMTTPRPLILLVDSCRDTCAMYATCLSCEGFKSVSATDGEAAIELLRTVAPQVVVTALWIPRIGGAAIVERTRAILGNVVPILVVTGETRAAEHARAIDAGANRILVKPCSPDVLWQEIRNLMPIGALPAPA